MIPNFFLKNILKIYPVIQFSLYTDTIQLYLVVFSCFDIALILKRRA